MTIKTKQGDRKRLDLSGRDEHAWAQRVLVREVERQYNSGKPVRIIALKGRQLGISTVSEAIMFWWGFYHHNTNGLVMAHDSETTANLFEMTKFFWETWPFKDGYSLRYATRRQMQWIETQTNIQVATAKNTLSGRGFTRQAVHASECAFYADATTLFGGLHESIPYAHGTFEILESTANGIGNWFYHQWQRAVDGDSTFTPIFLPWINHYEYRLSTTLASTLELDADEKNILRHGGSYENIAWRRMKLSSMDGNLQRFQAEYPVEPEEAFIATGRPIFPRQKVKECYAGPKPSVRGMLVRNGRGESEFVKDPNGPLTIFKSPSIEVRPDLYFVAADPSGVIGGVVNDGDGDPACIQVLNRATYEQVAVWHGMIDPIHFAHEIAKLGHYYHDAEVCPEIQGGGSATIATLLTMGYPNIYQARNADSITVSNITYGWSTNWKRKEEAIGNLLGLFAHNSIVIHDQKTYEQLLNYVVRDNGEWGNVAGMNDDAVMALAIAVTASRSEGPVEVYNYPDHFETFRQEFAHAD